MIRLPSPVAKIDWAVSNTYNVNISIKREDLIHPVISGNKWRKLKYNIQYCKAQGYRGILSFGGAFSNHLAALSYACSINNLKSIGMLRGEAVDKDNPTIQFVEEHGMHLELMDRETYRKKNDPRVLKSLEEKYPDYYIVPEGGSNSFAIRGVGELVDELEDSIIDYLCVSAGTAYTSIGILIQLDPSMVKKVLVFSSLKGDFLKEEIEKYADDIDVEWELVTDYHFGGYARTNTELINFINKFSLATGIPLDPVYNGKMLFGIRDMITKGSINTEANVLAIHTGGLQGITGHNYRYKNRPELLINV